MKDGVLRDMRAILAQNGRLAANGARRTGGEINEMANVVYSTCNLCKSDPTKPPLWQLRARKAVQDLEHKKIEYEDAVLQMYGIPVAYFPYFWHVDPSVKRASGLLIPSVGESSGLGAFYRPAVLLGDRRPVRRHLHADVHHAARPADRRRVPPPLQRRVSADEFLARLREQFAAVVGLREGAVQLRRYLALGLQPQPGVVGGLHPGLSPGPGPGRRRQSADQPGLPGRLRRRRLFAARYPVLPGHQPGDHQLQAAGGAAAVSIQLFRPARCLGRPAQPGHRHVQRVSHRRHRHAPRQPDAELGAPVHGSAGRHVEADAARRCRGLRRQRVQRAAEFRHARPDQ